MAAATARGGKSGIFWMNGASDEEQPLVFVPGVEGEVRTLNLGAGVSGSSSKRGAMMRAKRSFNSKSEPTLRKGGKKQGLVRSEHLQAYTKEKVSVHHGAAAHTEQDVPPANGTFHLKTQVIPETSRAKSQVSLKDLCPEDKRRIANLIEELARVSEEKEESVQRLKNEQEQFESKIQQLEQQNVIIAQERESLQQQYRECQELLGLYQQYLSQQQAKLNQSIAQLSQAAAHSKVLSSEEAPSSISPSRANGSLFDGSYLGVAANQARQPQLHRRGGGGRGAVQTFSNSVSLSGEMGPTNGLTKHHRSQKRESHHRCVDCQVSGQDSDYLTQQWKCDNSSRLENGNHETLNQHERPHSGNAIGSEAKEALTRPLLGHEDWEEKRHQLLLQKMQLEMERERLQARLAEQEERLNRQNQQLHQSRLDYCRFQQDTQSDLSSSNTRNSNSQPEGPSHQDLPSSVSQYAEVNPSRQSLHDECPQSTPALLDTGGEALERTTKDMATSPVTSTASLSKPASVSVPPMTPDARLDFSVVELLDIFSPVSAPELSRLSTHRPKTSQRRPAPATPMPVSRTLLTPIGPCPQDTQQDLEESRMLEDIFFIC